MVDHTHRTCNNCTAFNRQRQMGEPKCWNLVSIDGREPSASDWCDNHLDAMEAALLDAQTLTCLNIYPRFCGGMSVFSERLIRPTLTETLPSDGEIRTEKLPVLPSKIWPNGTDALQE